MKKLLSALCVKLYAIKSEGFRTLMRKMINKLDGGQALLIILCRFLSPRTASIVLDVISFIILIPAACIGFFVLLNSQYNFTLLITALYLIALILLKHKKG